MINPKFIILLILGCLAMAWACKPARNPDHAAASVSEAMEHNDIDAARSRADALFASGVRLDTIAVPRLCMLSVSLAKLADCGDHTTDYTAQALQCYRIAMSRDSITATSFYAALSGDDYKYAAFLRQLGRSVDARDAGIYADEADSIATLKSTSDYE